MTDTFTKSPTAAESAIEPCASHSAESKSHEDIFHGNQQHHHHSHGTGTSHENGHHLLQVEDLSMGFRMYDPTAPYFSAKQRLIKTINNLSVSVHVGEILAVVGSSGSGKTLLADAIMGLFEPNSLVSGRIWFDGKRQSHTSLSRLRGKGVSLVPQSINHLDPLMRVGKQVEGYAKDKVTRKDRRAKRKRLFARYGLDETVAAMYPFELSGGMARRVLLCCALMDDPSLIIADEPTPGLDLDLAIRAMDDFRAFANAGGGVLLITHDIELALRVADRVAVFKDGTVVEETAVESFSSPHLLRDDFSKDLWYALPEHGFHAAHATGDEKTPAWALNVETDFNPLANDLPKREQGC